MAFGVVQLVDSCIRIGYRQLKSYVLGMWVTEEGRYICNYNSHITLIVFSLRLIVIKCMQLKDVHLLFSN